MKLCLVALLWALSGPSWAQTTWDLGLAKVQAVELGYARDPRSGAWEPEVELRFLGTDEHRRFHEQVQVEFGGPDGVVKRWKTFVSLSPRTAQHRRVQGQGLPCQGELAACPPVRIRVLGRDRRREQPWLALPPFAIQKDSAPPQFEPLYAVKVMDGDTFQLQGGQRIRVLGVDTPERKRKDGRPGAEFGYQEAADFTWTKVMGGPLQLVLSTERQDAYGRWLASVSLDDGKDLGTLLLQRGLAKVYRSSGNPKQEDYLVLEERARKDALGIWAPQR